MRQFFSQTCKDIYDCQRTPLLHVMEYLCLKHSTLHVEEDIIPQLLQNSFELGFLRLPFVTA